MRDQGQRHDHVAAALAAGNDDDLVRIVARVEALSSFLGSEDGDNLAAGYRRAANILASEAKKGFAPAQGGVSVSLLAEPAERELANALDQAGLADKLGQEDFAAAFALLAALRPQVDRFFDDVMVAVDEKPLRENRLALLNTFVSTANQVAKLSLIEK